MQHLQTIDIPTFVYHHLSVLCHHVCFEVVDPSSQWRYPHHHYHRYHPVMILLLVVVVVVWNIMEVRHWHGAHTYVTWPYRTRQ